MADRNQAAQRESEARLILAGLVMLDDRRCLTTLPHPTADNQVDNDDLGGLLDIIERARKWISVEPGTMTGSDTSSGEVDGWQPIDTAPHDGRWHFIAHPAYGVPVVARRVGPGSDEFEWFWPETEPEQYEHPTHWAPRIEMPQTASRCPFADPTFSMDPREPCPVCGDLGTFDTEDAVSKCVGGKNK